jgi:hypothetical protein
MKNTHYFKFLVQDSIGHEFNSFKQAQKKAKKLNEKIYLAIFNYNNIYKEVYSEKIIKDESEIQKAKTELLKIYTTLIS